MIDTKEYTAEEIKAISQEINSDPSSEFSHDSRFATTRLKKYPELVVWFNKLIQEAIIQNNWNWSIHAEQTPVMQELLNSNLKDRDISCVVNIVNYVLINQGVTKKAI